jgi:predicted enzyme related to lactoylglutathione lyase
MRVECLINIDVDDLDKAVAFYEQALGLRCARRLFDDTAAEMLGASSALYLLQKADETPACKGASPLRDYRRHWTPVHLDFVVADIDAAIKQATAAGAMLESGPSMDSWGRLATLSDPFGNGFCLVQWSGRGYDEVAAR